MGSLIYGDATHIREQAKIDAARITQASGNERRGAESALASFSASLGNKRRMDAAGSAVNDSTGNSARMQRQLTTGRLSERIRAAEELGTSAAVAATAGVGGASVESYNETVRLNNAMREQQLERSFSEQEWASGEQRGNAIKAAVAGLDNNQYRANMDYTQYVDHKKASFLERAIGLAATVGATVFAGPQAGSAVMGVFEARQASRNGDFGGASQALMGSFQNGMGALRTNHLTSDGPERSDIRTTVQDVAQETERNIFQFKTSAPTWGSVTLK